MFGCSAANKTVKLAKVSLKNYKKLAKLPNCSSFFLSFFLQTSILPLVFFYHEMVAFSAHTTMPQNLCNCIGFNQPKNKALQHLPCSWMPF